MDRPTKEETKEIWTNFEFDVARAFKGKQTIGSGNKKEKGDVHAGDMYMIECKYRWEYDEVFKQFYITIYCGWLETVWRNARKAKRIPIVAIETGNHKRFLLVPLCDCKDLSITIPDLTNEVRSGRGVSILTTGLPSSITFSDIRVIEKTWIVLPWSKKGLLVDSISTENIKIDKKSSIPKKSMNSKSSMKSSGFPSKPFTRGTKGFGKRKRKD